jgi:hypothetical protein
MRRVTLLRRELSEICIEHELRPAVVGESRAYTVRDVAERGITIA